MQFQSPLLRQSTTAAAAPPRRATQRGCPRPISDSHTGLILLPEPLFPFPMRSRKATINYYRPRPGICAHSPILVFSFISLLPAVTITHTLDLPIKFQWMPITYHTRTAPLSGPPPLILNKVHFYVKVVVAAGRIVLG